MKVVILAGGFGTRISEESHLIPKPMIEIGEKPILWHIMKLFSYYGFNDFIILAGYKQHVIKEWFSNYYLYNSDVTFDFKNNNKMIIHQNISEPWRVTIVDTGLNTMTGGRIKRIENYIDEDNFFLTYGDAVSDVKIDSLLKQHINNSNVVTLTAYDLGQDKGILELAPNNQVISFREKDNSDGALINAGFMVVNKEIFKYIEDDKTIFEKDTLPKLVKDKKLGSYIHKGFWQCMDTQRDKKKLEMLWGNQGCPWKIW